jgi:hypothetical protein
MNDVIMDVGLKKQFDDFILSQGGLFVAHERLIVSRQQLVDVQGEISQNSLAFISTANSMLVPFVSRLRSQMSAYASIHAYVNYEFRNLVKTVFLTVFTRMRSRTLDVVKLSSLSNRTLTVGSQGFGFRRNIKSSPVSSFSDIVDIVKHKDLVVQGLASFSGMKKWIDKFLLFCSVFPSLDLEFKSVKYSLSSFVLVPSSRLSRDYYKYDFPLRAKMCSVTSSGLELYDEQHNSVRSIDLNSDFSQHNSVRSIDLNPDFSVVSWEDALCVFQLIPFLSFILSECERDSSVILSQIKEVKTKLRTCFGTELLFAEL